MKSKIKDIMTSDVHVILPECNIQEAAQKMMNLDVGALPVCDGKKLLGIVTDRDIALRAVASGCDIHNTKAREIMSSPIVYCFENQDIEEVSRIMEVKQIRRLVVLNQEKKLVGIVSLGDIAVKTGRDDLAGEILEKVSMTSAHTQAAFI